MWAEEVVVGASTRQKRQTGWKGRRTGNGRWRWQRKSGTSVKGGVQPLRRENPYYHPRGNVASLALERLPPTCVGGRGSCWGINETKETDGVEGEAIWEWEVEVVEKVRHECEGGVS